MKTKFKRVLRTRVPLQNGAGLPIEGDSDRRGSVLLVVIGLLGMLLLIGIAFYSFAGQEITNGQIYAEAAKVEHDGLTAEKLFSFALEQLILGTNDTNKQHSALWGRRHALLTGVLGRTGTANFDGFDLTPYNGAGINLRYSSVAPFGTPEVDQDYDGVADASQSLLNFNYSPAANGGVAPAVPTAPAPDVDYTAPDINTLALAFVGRGIDGFGADVNVIIPSFHRPQLLRSGGGPIVGWQTSPATAQRVMRPHPNHTALAYDPVAQTYSASPSGYSRFLNAPAVNALGQTVNPFPFGTAATVQQGVWDLTGPPAGAINNAMDADNDGDGIREGIWMDLDFPVQSLADGRKYVPLFSFTVIDVDSLINLNVSGNQSGLAALTLPLATSRHVSRSNQGLSRAEISPAWAMYADPTAASLTATTQHHLFWNTAPGTISRTEMANIETLFLNMGRPDFTTTGSGTYTIPSGPGLTYEPTKYYPGRYGEAELLGPNNNSPNGIAGYGRGAPANRDFTYLPQAGRSAQLFGASGDDDFDNQVGHSRIDSAGYFFGGTSFTRMQSNVAIPGFNHPLDFIGDGVNLTYGPTGLQTQRSTGGMTTPMQWPIYSSGYSTPGFDTTGSGFINYLSAGAPSALLPLSHGPQFDEADEIIAEWELATTNATMQQDEIFGPENMFELQGTNSDLSSTNLTGRMRNLVPFNFQQATAGEAIRHQFTVSSHDRKTFGLAPFYRRGWEFNADADSDGNLEFPTAFLSVAGTSAAEPFRQVLRQLLYVELNQATTTTTLAQLRLNLNRLLTGYDTTTGPVGAPIYRDLTAHPAVALPNTPIVAPTWNADSPTGTPSPNDQEWWARYDRQRMARDIYVLLYTLGGGMDATPYNTSNAGNVLYSVAQTTEMAQFAVNVVDELDRDDVITKFEFDRDLGDGWSLDDNPYNSLADPENALNASQRAVVYGVEAQKLTLSELLLIISRRVETSPGSMTYTNHVATQVDDTGASDRLYTYIELRNTSPYTIDLSSGAWQIAVQDDPDGIVNNGDETDRVELTLLSGNGSSTIPPGALFTIGTRGGPSSPDPAVPTNNLPSLFKVDTTGSATPMFTSSTTWIAPPSGALDLDLIPTTVGAPNNTALFRMTSGSASAPTAGTDYTIPGTGTDVTTAGNFLFGGAGGNVSAAQETAPHIFVLRRRANLTRTMPVSYSSSAATHTNQSLDNPWIEVDRLTMPTWRDFSLLPSDTMTDVQTKLGPLTSYERAQPFSRNLAGGEAAHIAAGAAPYQANSIAANNSNSPTPFTQIQLHFDRDFASPIDLLSVPLYGPDQVTRRVGQPARFNGDTPPTSMLAQERFLRPQSYVNLAAGVPAGTIPSPATALTDTLNNRWYRLLEFIEVPNQTELGLQSFPYALRNSGAINLNGVRHRGVLAGVLDDTDNPTTGGTVEGHFNPAYGAEATMLYDQFEGASRDWWLQFLGSRDGVDPITGLVLPGTPAGRPFRSLGYAERSSTSLEDTILRSLPADVVAAGGSVPAYADRRTLFEARTTGDRLSNSGGDVVDSMIRHRLLRKAMNNTTTRSNVFAVWITTRLFEAIQQPFPATGAGGEVQIGDALQGATDHRGFFVIDRSLPEQAYQPYSGKFDFRKFVQYRKTIQ